MKKKHIDIRKVRVREREIVDRHTEKASSNASMNRRPETSVRERETSSIHRHVYINEWKTYH